MGMNDIKAVRAKFGETSVRVALPLSNVLVHITMYHNLS